MWQYVTKRVLLMIPTLLGAALVIFLLMNIVPGDIALLIIGGDQGGDINPRELARLRAQLGLDQPLYVQFFSWLWDVVTLDFGKSLWTGAPIMEELWIRLPLSLEVAILATIVSVIIAIPLGTIAAIRQDTWVDYVVRVDQHRWSGHPLILDGDYDYSVPGDFFRMGSAPGICLHYRGSVGKL